MASSFRTSVLSLALLIAGFTAPAQAFTPIDDAGKTRFTTRWVDDAVAAWNTSHLSPYQRSKVANYFVLRYSDDCEVDLPDEATVWPSDSDDRGYQRQKREVLREFKKVALPETIYRTSQKEVCEVTAKAACYLKTGAFSKTQNPKTQGGVSNARFNDLFGKTANGDCEKFGCVEREYVDHLAGALAEKIGFPVVVTIDDAQAKADLGLNYVQDFDQGYRLSTVDKDDFILQHDLAGKNRTSFGFDGNRVSVKFDARWLAVSEEVVAFVIAKDAFAALSKVEKEDGSWSFDFSKTNEKAFEFVKSENQLVEEQDFKQMVAFTRLRMEAHAGRR